MADQRWSDIYVVFTKILCGRNFCVWYVTKLKFTGYLQMAPLCLSAQFETNLMSNRKVIELLLQLKSTKVHRTNYIEVKPHLVHYLLRNRLLFTYVYSLIHYRTTDTATVSKPRPLPLPSHPTKIFFGMGRQREGKQRLRSRQGRQYAIQKIKLLHNLSCLETRFRQLCVDSLLHSSLNLAFRQRKLITFYFRNGVLQTI